MKKRFLLLIPGIALVVIASYLTMGKVSADEDFKYPPLIQEIIDKFNLNTDEVDKVIAVFRDERHAERKAIVEEKLNAAVEEGKITQAQKDLILQKLTEWESVPPEDKQQMRAGHREEMETWAEENGIDWQTVMGFLRLGGREDGLGPRGRMGPGR